MTIKVEIEIVPISERLPESHKAVLVYCCGSVSSSPNSTFEVWQGFFDASDRTWYVKDDGVDVYSGQRYSALKDNGKDWTDAVAWAEIPLIQNFNLFDKYHKR